eukprot:952329-Amphidinium_carterae.1
MLKPSCSKIFPRQHGLSIPESACFIHISSAKATPMEAVNPMMHSRLHANPNATTSIPTHKTTTMQRAPQHPQKCNPLCKSVCKGQLFLRGRPEEACAMILAGIVTTIRFARRQHSCTRKLCEKYATTPLDVWC